MSVAFGFSVGDFIAGINVIRELRKALEDGAGASAEYCSLIAELSTLEIALQQVQELALDESKRLQHEALKQAALRCQHSVERFLERIVKFQPNLQAGGSSSQWKDRLRKIQWALCKKEDVQRFRAETSGHVSCIQLLLIALQM